MDPQETDSFAPFLNKHLPPYSDWEQDRGTELCDLELLIYGGFKA
jgi:hypothetical protein